MDFRNRICKSITLNYFQIFFFLRSQQVSKEKETGHRVLKRMCLGIIHKMSISNVTTICKQCLSFLAEKAGPYIVKVLQYHLFFPNFTYPSESKTSNRIGQHVSKQGGKRVQSGKVGMHIRTLPMGNLGSLQNTQNIPSAPYYYYLL